MSIAFWTALIAGLLYLAILALAAMAMDTWGERLIQLAYVAGAVAVCAGVVFVGWFALDSLGVHISYQGMGASE